MAKKKEEALEVQPGVYDVMKLLAIESNVSRVQKKYKISGSTTDIEARKSTAVSTGLLMEDILLGGGVYPGGWYTIFGGEQSSKSTNMMTMACSFYNSGVPLIWYQDAEGCVTEDTLIRVDGKDVSFRDLLDSVLPYNVEHHVKELSKLLKGGANCTLDINICVDTLDRRNAKAKLFYGGYKPITEIRLFNGKSLKGHNHPVRVIRKNSDVAEWIKIESIRLDDIIVNVEDWYVDSVGYAVVSIQKLDYDHVWDVSIVDAKETDTLPHSIITNGLLTHNSTTPEYIDSIANNLGTDGNMANMFGLKDQKGNWVVEPRMTLTNDNSLETFYKSLSTLLKSLPDKIFVDGEWWLLFDRTKENMSRLKGKHNTKIGDKYGKIAMPSLDGGTPQALILLDSLPMLVTDSEDTEDGDNSLGVDARGHSKHLKKLRGKLKRKHATVIAINQLRAAIMTNYGPPEYEPCFIGSTPVLLADGTYKTIREIVDNRLEVNVASLNIETGEISSKPIIDWKNNGVKSSSDLCMVMYQVVSTELEGVDPCVAYVVCTKDHKIWTSTGWIEAFNLKENDDIMVGGTTITYDDTQLVNQYSKVVSVNECKGDEEVNVYDLTVADNHTYFVGKCRNAVINSVHENRMGNVILESLRIDTFTNKGSIAVSNCGNAVKYAADVRVKQTSRAIPHGSGSIEEEPSVIVEGGTDQYRYINMKGHKNKFGTPYIEVWCRLWVADTHGIGHGFDVVWDTYQYLKTTGQLEGNMRKLSFSIGKVSTKKMTWLEFKELILFNKDKKAFKEIAQKVGIEKYIDIRKLCFEQIKSGGGMEKFFTTLHNLNDGPEEAEEIPIEDWERDDLVKEAVALKLGKKADFKKTSEADLIEMIENAWAEIEEDNEE